MSDARTQVLDEVRPVSEAFVAAGHAIYLVGGVVRDLELGAALDEIDLDMTTDARPGEIRSVVEPMAEALWAQGEKFGTIGVRVGGRPYEITTHRAESYSDDSRKPEVAFGNDVEVDLSRRDFTVNAMALRLPEGELIDPFDGRGALERRVLETPIEATVSFSDDPLRILRAARFIARYGLRASTDLIAAATALVERLSIVSAERVRDELDKLLGASEPSAGIEFLDAVGALRVIFDGHMADALRVGRTLDASPVDVVLRRSLIFAALAPDSRNSQISALRYSNDEQRQLRDIQEGFDRLVSGPTHGTEWDDEDLRRLVDTVGIENMPTVIGRAQLAELPATAMVSGRLDQLSLTEDLSSFTPSASGEQVMRALGLEPGPTVGEAMALLRERRLQYGPADSEAELAYLVSVWPAAGR